MSVRWGTRSADYVGWDSRVIAEADFIVRYNIDVSGTWATLEINGSIGLTAEREFVAQYTILSPVSTDFPLLYQVDGAAPASIPVSRDFSVVYSIDSELDTIEVSQDFQVFWQSAGIVIADFQASYFVLQDTAFPGWNPETPTDEDWSLLASSVKSWTPATQPSTTWN